MKKQYAVGLLVLLCGSSDLVASNIDPDQRYAWCENVGWTNWRDANAGAQGVRVTAAALSGFIWAENVGWINVGNGPGPYENDPADSSTFGVNVDPVTGELHGLAWGENIGWINFDTRAVLGLHNQQARLDMCDNTLLGYAWGENIGWINLDDATHFVALGPVCLLDDVACDGEIALTDYAVFQEVFMGPGVPSDCAVFDADGDGDVDLHDFSVFNQLFTGMP